MSGRKSSKAAIRTRVDVVYRLLLLGLDRQRIIEHVRGRHPSWPKSESAIDRYIKQANELLVEVGQADRQVEFGRALARLHDLYARSVAAKDRSNELAVIKMIIDLLGLKTPFEVDIAEARRKLVDLMIEEVMREAEDATAGAAQTD